MWTWWSTISVWCVYVLNMGVCASSGSMGFWTIIPAALRSQLLSHAHIWHSFPDMITIHLPLWVWLRRIFPSFPSGIGATFQKWTAHPTTPLLALLYPTPTPCFPSTPLSPPYTTRLQHRFLLCCNRNPLLQPFFPLSQLFVTAGMIGSFGSDISSVTSRLDREGRGGIDERERQPWNYLTTACFCSTVLSDPSHCVHSETLWCGAECWFFFSQQLELSSFQSESGSS